MPNSARLQVESGADQTIIKPVRLIYWLQLQVMGHLASSGTVSLGSGDSTICFAIDANVVSNNAYQIELLTVLTEVGSAIESTMPNITNLASLPPNLVSKVLPKVLGGRSLWCGRLAPITGWWAMPC